MLSFLIAEYNNEAEHEVTPKTPTKKLGLFTLEGFHDDSIALTEWIESKLDYIEEDITKGIFDCD